MRTRQERRSFTDRYQKRQIALRKAYQYDDDLEPNERTLGRYRKTSAFDCGKAGCNLCCSPRRSNWGSGRARLTLQENRNQDSFDYQLDHYHNSHDCDSTGL